MTSKRQKELKWDGWNLQPSHDMWGQNKKTGFQNKSQWLRTSQFCPMLYLGIESKFMAFCE